MAISSWLAAERPHSPQTARHVEAVCRGFLCPSLGTSSDYQGWMRAAGLQPCYFADLTPQVARTWEICSQRVRRSGVRLLARCAGLNMRRFVDQFDSILEAYNTGAMRVRMLRGPELEEASLRGGSVSPPPLCSGERGANGTDAKPQAADHANFLDRRSASARMRCSPRRCAGSSRSCKGRAGLPACCCPLPARRSADWGSMRLLALQFAVIHSWFLLPSTRDRLTRFLPSPQYGCCFCVVTCCSLLLTIEAWQPVSGGLWQLHGLPHAAMMTAFLLTWAGLFYSLHLTGLGYQTGWTPWWAWVRGRDAATARRSRYAAPTASSAIPFISASWDWSG